MQDNIQDGTVEEKLDTVLTCLYNAYLHAEATEKINDAFIYDTAIVEELEMKYTIKNINFISFINRLERDDYVRKIREESNIYKYKISPKGVDFINSGGSYKQKAA